MAAQLTWDWHKLALLRAAGTAFVGQLALLRLGALQDGAGLLGAAQLVLATLADQAAVVDRGDNLVAFGDSLAVDLATCTAITTITRRVRNIIRQFRSGNGL